MGLRKPGIYKSRDEMRLMVRPGVLTASSLDAVEAALRPGVTTGELDVVAETAIREGGGIPNFMLVPGYRNTICSSVNDEVVHGIPGARILRPGDIVSIDSGAEVAGWNGDSARTFVLDDPDRPELVAERRRLNDVTEQALWHGIAALAGARRLDEVGGAIEDYVEAQGAFGIIEDYTGHGIGRSMHEDPPVFNYRVSGRSPVVKPGLVVAIEPMITLGTIDTVTGSDDWTVATTDASDASHWEHSVAVHDDGIWVLTAHDGGAAGLAALGVRPVPVP
ncbi:type I methionyl aminopeptidase [Frigoribacterium faeni]|uniref:Methionine aminopeptidase n=1 Tax=Frigoribacterium faeni TaxID=145483 RepID=A0A7W3JL40_9MICO|nr:type I methionyl aminopeptidase [Frigoribacterium faeni]MBA8814867.1 methionyl aminopeptidase [Frigoribacterium faeni]BFF15409.1 type I methionyl aminopeptidase [Microbacterium flavescens]GEK82568.1 methionine aminopeptidase [Frigoribacterium faeni]